MKMLYLTSKVATFIGQITKSYRRGVAVISSGGAYTQRHLILRQLGFLREQKCHLPVINISGKLNYLFIIYLGLQGRKLGSLKQ